MNIGEIMSGLTCTIKQFLKGGSIIMQLFNLHGNNRGILNAFGFMFLALLIFQTNHSFAQSKVATEYQVKSAFMINFAKFVEWPPEALGDASPEIILGILGDDPFEDNIESLAGSGKVHDRDLIVKRFKRIEDIKVCHILFISSSEKNRLEEIMESIEGQKFAHYF